jgi:hypothetical protein
VVARGKRDLDISADYVENDIREMDEVSGRALSGQSDSLGKPSDKDADEFPQDEKDHGSDNKKVDRGQRPSLSMDTPTVMRLRKPNEQKLNVRGEMSHDASWYA